MPGSSTNEMAALLEPHIPALRRYAWALLRDDGAADDLVQDCPEAALGAHDVLAGLDLLPEEQRSVLLLVGVEDLSYEEAARVLHIPIGTVMSRLSRAREKMRQHLETGRGTVLRRV